MATRHVTHAPQDEGRGVGPDRGLPGPPGREGEIPGTQAALVLTAANYTRIGYPIVGPRNERRAIGQLVVGNGSSTYPSGGIALPITPTQGGLGLARSLTFLDIMDVTSGAAPGAAIPTVTYDNVNKTLRLFHPGGLGGVDAKDAVEYTTADVPLAMTLGIVAYGI